MSEILEAVLRMPDNLFWADDPISRYQHNQIRLEAADRIALLEARMEQARHELEKCRMWTGSGYDWHPLHAREAWRILREVLPTAYQRLYALQEQGNE